MEKIMSEKQIIQLFYSSLGQGDIASALSILAEDIVWKEMEGWPYQPTGSGPEEIANGVFAPLARDWDQFSAAPDKFFADEETISVLGVYSGINKSTGKTLAAPYVHVWTVSAGKAIRFNQYTDTLLMNQAMI
jgi:ketosteroid isomerase-like protein